MILDFTGLNLDKYSDIAQGTDLMEYKLNDGKIDYDNIELLKMYSALSYNLLTRWYHKYEEKDFDERYNLLKIITQTECKEAYDVCDSNNTSNKEFGKTMLLDVKSRLRQRYDDDIKNRYYDFIYEHLLGISGILTEDCIIKWSKNLRIPEWLK